MKTIFSLVISALLFAACTKHKDDVEDAAPKATFEFTSPAQGAFYNSGDSVLIQGTATAAATMHGYDVIIRKPSDTAKLFFQHYHDHKTTLNIDTRWKADEIHNTNLQAEVIVYLDHEGHTDSKKVGFSIR